MRTNPSALIAFISREPRGSAAGRERRSTAQPLGMDLSRVLLLERVWKWGDSQIRGEIQGWVGKGCSEAGGVESGGFTASILVTLGGMDGV